MFLRWSSFSGLVAYLFTFFKLCLLMKLTFTVVRFITYFLYSFIVLLFTFSLSLFWNLCLCARTHVCGVR